MRAKPLSAEIKVKKNFRAAENDKNRPTGHRPAGRFALYSIALWPQFPKAGGGLFWRFKGCQVVSNDCVLHSGCLLSAAVPVSVTASLLLEDKRTAALIS